jgi:hypothetical protein
VSQISASWSGRRRRDPQLDGRIADPNEDRGSWAFAFAASWLRGFHVVDLLRSQSCSK